MSSLQLKDVFKVVKLKLRKKFSLRPITIFYSGKISVDRSRLLIIIRIIMNYEAI
jgi:hypothetical protein